MRITTIGDWARLARLWTAVPASVLAFGACGGGDAGGTSPAVPADAVPRAAALARADVAPVAVPTPTNEIYLGAWANPPGDPPGWTSSQKIAALEKAIGRKFAISLHYDDFAATFPSPDEANDRENHRIPLVSLNCDDTDFHIAHGAQDAVLSAKADAIAAFGAPVMLRYKWEFNLPDTVNGREICYDPVRDRNGYFSPQEYIAAYRHIRLLMTARGATNIAWVWNPSDGGANGLPYWPGDNDVDWVGIDVYDFSPDGLDALGPPYAMYAPAGAGTHPVIIGETGALPPDQPGYLNARAALVLRQKYPHIEALDYFDASGPVDNFSFTPAGLTTFTNFAAQPSIGGTPPPFTR